MPAFATRVLKGGRVVVHDGLLIVTEVPKHSDDYRGCEDAVDVAALIAHALEVFTDTPEGQREYESVRDSCDRKPLGPVE